MSQEYLKFEKICFPNLTFYLMYEKKKNDEDTTMLLKRDVYLVSIYFVCAIEKLNMDEMEYEHSI